jgi:hypothetical protein
MEKGIDILGPKFSWLSEMVKEVNNDYGQIKQEISKELENNLTIFGLQGKREAITHAAQIINGRKNNPNQIEFLKNRAVSSAL